MNSRPRRAGKDTEKCAPRSNNASSHFGSPVLSQTKWYHRPKNKPKRLAMLEKIKIPHMSFTTTASSRPCCLISSACAQAWLPW